ncbi:hypothetical protein GTR04_3200 [Trichophyton interdigitale]|nr:hypothetical protein GY631_3131 [Trichophyton interdigitale]KAG5218451.1 hypothetical protein GY632_5543 [Trichophyton interdigitale]KAG8209427.1 hypothetical protein GTR04_3200 [Trichophyton interdigitale]
MTGSPRELPSAAAAAAAAASQLSPFFTFSVTCGRKPAQCWRVIPSPRHRFYPTSQTARGFTFLSPCE